MADRKTSAAVRLLVDTTSGLTLTATLTDGLNTTQGTGPLTEVGSSGRYYGAITPTGNVCEGEWTATYSDGTVQTFTVGDTSGMDKWTLRNLLASRVDETHYGTVTFANGVDLVDDALFGVEGDFLKMWMLLNSSSNESGLYRRITGYNGSALTLSSAWGSDPAAGSSFLLTNIHPRELEQVFQTTYQTLGNIGRVKVKAESLTPDADGRVAIPAGWTHVYDVWSKAGDDTSALLSDAPLTTWQPTAGRYITVDSLDASSSVTLYGLRNARTPLWDDSHSDLDAETVLALASSQLNIARASGSALDPEDHMHRQIAAFQELETVLRRNAGRAANNQREVIQ